MEGPKLIGRIELPDPPKPDLCPHCGGKMAMGYCINVLFGMLDEDDDHLEMVEPDGRVITIRR